MKNITVTYTVDDSVTVAEATAYAKSWNKHQGVEVQEGPTWEAGAPAETGEGVDNSAETADAGTSEGTNEPAADQQAAA